MILKPHKMQKEYTIPEMLKIAAIRGYSPQLASALNTLLTTKSEIVYQKALKQATKEISGYSQVEELQKQEIGNYTVKGDLYDLKDKAHSVASHFDGLPIYQPFLLEKIGGIKSDLLLDSAILEVSRTKNVVVTQVQGRNSSVKEFINNGDFSIKVSGIICEKGLGYPLDLVKQHEEFMKAQVSIPVVSEVMQNLGIYEIVITDYSYPSSPFANCQPYSFSAISEEPTIIRI